MAVHRHVRYYPLPTDDVDDGRDLRYKYTPKALERVPWRSIALAIFLLLMGSTLLLLALFVFSGHLEADLSQGFGLMVVGILAFVPGFYETRIAYYSWRGIPGVIANIRVVIFPGTNNISLFIPLPAFVVL